MSEIRRTRVSLRSLAETIGAAVIAAAVVLGIPSSAASAAAATAAAATAHRVAAITEHTGSAIGGDPVDWNSSTDALLAGAHHSVRATATTTSTRSARRAGGGLAARLGEARRTDGRLGQWVVGVLVSITVVLCVVLVAVVVRAHMRFAESSPSRRSTGGPAG